MLIEEAKEAAKEMVNMKDTVWYSVKEWLRAHGIINPTNQQVLELSKQVTQDNHLGVKIWEQIGNPMDTAMKQGYLLDFSGAKKLFLKKFASALGGIWI